MKYRVIHQDGFHVRGERLAKGAIFEKAVEGADIRAAIHFRQIEKVKDKAKAEDPDAEAKGKSSGK